jgi:hypothetical protein
MSDSSLATLNDGDRDQNIPSFMEKGLSAASSKEELSRKTRVNSKRESVKTTV